MSKYDLMLDLKIKVGRCDLYFMVHRSYTSDTSRLLHVEYSVYGVVVSIGMHHTMKSVQMNETS